MPSLPRYRAKGERGSWFALVNGERLPCVHQHWLTKLHYHDPHYVPERQWIEFVAAIKNVGKVILTTDRVHPDGRGFDRTGYVAVFRVSDVSVSGPDLEFDLVERLAELE